MTKTKQPKPTKENYKLTWLHKHLSDRTWRLNNLYYIVNEKGEKIKFRLNAVQKELLNNFWYLNIILKSRQHGVTTFVCLLYLDACLFNANMRAGIIAHNREDAESFFKDKVKFAYDNLPEELRIRIPSNTDSAKELSFNNNSAIRVGTSLRSGTFQLLHISEFAKICRKYPEKAFEIVTGSLNTVHAGQYITIESTAEGHSGYFYDFCMEAQKNMIRGVPLTQLDMKFHFFPWHMDMRNMIDPTDVVIPDRLKEYFQKLQDKYGIKILPAQQAWYTKKWVLQGEAMKREHPTTPEEAFEASVEGAYFASQFDRIYRENRITQVPYVEGIPVNTAWDLGVNDTTVIWFFQKHGQTIRVIDHYENSGEGLAFYSTILRAKGYEYGVHYAPHDIEVRELGSGKSRKEIAEDYGIEFETAPKLSKQDQIEAARKLLGFCWFDESKTDKGIKALESYRKQWDEANGCYRDSPLHDWASNSSDAFQIMAVCEDITSPVSKGSFVPDRLSNIIPFRTRQAVFAPARRVMRI